MHGFDGASEFPEGRATIQISEELSDFKITSDDLKNLREIKHKYSKFIANNLISIPNYFIWFLKKKTIGQLALLTVLFYDIMYMSILNGGK